MMMQCAKCGYNEVAVGDRFCPNCGQAVVQAPKPATQIDVTQEVGRVDGGGVTGVEIQDLSGPVTIESTVNQIESHVVQGNYVSRDAITNHITVVGDPHMLEEVLRRLMRMEDIDERTLRNPGAVSVPEHVSRQITEVMAAQDEVAARGIEVTPEALYRLGMLAAHQREYEAAVGYFRQATQANPEFTDAYAAITWLQQSRAMHDIQARDYESAMKKLGEARTAARHTDPLDPRALTLRGYLSKTMAQIAGLRGNASERATYYEEAGRFFNHVVGLAPDNAGAHNGLGNVAYARGDLDGAIASYRRAIELAPSYTAAYNDLAWAYEGKMDAEPDQREAWCREALTAWRAAYRLAPNDPGFSERNVITIGRRILRLEQLCPSGA